MATFNGWTRRSFVRMAGMASLAAQASWLNADSSRGDARVGGVQKPRFAFVGAGTSDDGRPQGVSAYAVDGDAWTLQQFVASEAPVCVVLHPSGRWLYVLNEVREFAGLPSGSVEAYGVDEESGRLDLLARRGLSLSATMPRHMAVSLDGRSLAVAVDGGGAYNRVPILEDGSLGRVSGILKETGCGPIALHQASARPQAVIFDPTGERVIASDLGGDRLSVFALAGGIEGGLAVRARKAMQAGSGPRHLAFHPGGDKLYVSHALDGSLSGYGYDRAAGKITERLSHVQGDFGDALAISPDGDFLYAAGRGTLTTFQIDAATGSLRKVHEQRLGEVRALSPLDGGQGLLALNAEGVLRMDWASGCLGDAAMVASLPGARCIAVQ